MARPGFRYAVILAGMRTGSNLLEESLGSFDDIAAHGELFNPHFFGRPGQKEAFGFSFAGRDADPGRVLEAMENEGTGLQVFRFFQDHDPRVLEAVLSDPSVAKILLRRPALDSWVSLKIARKTGQWWLGDARRAKTAKVAFDAADFANFVEGREAFYHQIEARLRRSGQTAFALNYEDLFDDEVIAGLARWLGSEGVRSASKVKARVQNPTPLSERLIEPDAVARTLARTVLPDLSAVRDYEPPRGPGVRGFVACEDLPLLYMPIRGAAADPVADWLAHQSDAGDILTDMTQKDLRQWWREHPGHRSFTILRHPLRRAWDAFTRHIMPTDGFAEIRAYLVQRHDMPIPEAGWDPDMARAAFLTFLRFLEANLAGQTSVRVDASWTSQSRHLSAISGFVTPDFVMREESLDVDIDCLKRALGFAFRGTPAFEEAGAIKLEEVVTGEIEQTCARAYRRDMLQFGFGGFAG